MSKKKIFLLGAVIVLILCGTSLKSRQGGSLYACFPSRAATNLAMSKCFLWCEIQRGLECQDPIPWLYWCSSGGDCVCNWKIVCGQWPGIWLDYWTVDINHEQCETIWD